MADRPEIVQSDRREFLGSMGRLTLGAAALGATVPALAGAQPLPGPITLHCLCPTWCREEDIKKFEAQFKVEAKRSCWVSYLSTLTKMSTGGTKIWDVVAQHHAFMYPLMRRGLLHPIDLAKVPNAKQLFSEFASMEHARYEGKIYGIPYVWTFDSVVYNANHISNVDSWGVLFDEKYAGKLALRDDPQNAIQLTALYMGYKDPSVLAKEDLTQIKKFLISKKHLFRKFWTGYAEAIALLRSGEVWALSGWRPMWWTLAKEGMNIRYAIPKEKGIGAINYYVVSKETKVLPTAYAFLNWMLDTEWGAATGRDQGYFSTSKLALKGLDTQTRQTLGYDHLADVTKNVYFLEYPLNLNEWVEAWSEVKSA